MKRTAVKRHLTHAGFSIPAFAKEIGAPESTIRRAIALEQIKFIDFGGLRRIPRSELIRLRSQLGIEDQRQQ